MILHFPVLDLPVGFAVMPLKREVAPPRLPCLCVLMPSTVNSEGLGARRITNCRVRAQKKPPTNVGGFLSRKLYED